MRRHVWLGAPPALASDTRLGYLLCVEPLSHPQHKGALDVRCRR